MLTEKKPFSRQSSRCKFLKNNSLKKNPPLSAEKHKAELPQSLESDEKLSSELIKLHSIESKSKSSSANCITWEKPVFDQKALDELSEKQIQLSKASEVFALQENRGGKNTAKRGSKRELELLSFSKTDLENATAQYHLVEKQLVGVEGERKSSSSLLKDKSSNLEKLAAKQKVN